MKSFELQACSSSSRTSSVSHSDENRILVSTLKVIDIPDAAGRKTLQDITKKAVLAT